MPRIPSRPPLDLSGKWAVVDLPTVDGDYLGLTPDPHVTIRHVASETFSATFAFGTQSGSIHGRVDEVWAHAAALFFTFVGSDEGDEISGAAADAKDDAITGTMRYHDGDDLPFVWKRLADPKAAAVRKRPRKR